MFDAHPKNDQENAEGTAKPIEIFPSIFIPF